MDFFEAFSIADWQSGEQSSQQRFLKNFKKLFSTFLAYSVIRLCLRITLSISIFDEYSILSWTAVISD
jgi:hypothetical protein